MDKTRKHNRGAKPTPRKTGRSGKTQPDESADKAKPVRSGPESEPPSGEAGSRAGEGKKEEKMTRSKLLSKDIENQSNIFALPHNKGELTQDDNAPAAETVEEENLRALLLDLRKDISALKEEQEETEAAPRDEETHLYDLLAALKDDIKVLKVEQEQTAAPGEEAQMFEMLDALKKDIQDLKAESAPPRVSENEDHMFGLLAELQSDIKTLKAEQDAPSVPEGEEHMFALLADLKNDINTLKAEHAGPAAPEGEEHLYELLADLKGDIKVLKAETASSSRSGEEDHIYGMLTELKQDINVLRHEHDIVPMPVAQPAVITQRPSGWGYMFAGAFIVLLVIGAGAGGYYFSTYQQGVKMKIAAPAVETQMTTPPATPAPEAVIAAPVKEAETANPAAAAPKIAAASAPEMRTVSGEPGAEIDLKINMTGASIKPETAIVLVGIPENFKLSAGKRTEEGEWVMTVWDTLRLTLTSPQDYEGEFDVAVSLMDAAGDLTEREKFKVVIAAPDAPARASEEAVAAAKAPGPAPASPPVLTSPEQKELIERANQLMDQGDIVSARNVLDYAVSSGSAEAAFKLAQTYDPLYLGKIKSVLGVKPDLVKAKVLYYFAARKGHEDASKRLSALREESGTSKP